MYSRRMKSLRKKLKRKMKRRLPMKLRKTGSRMQLRTELPEVTGAAVKLPQMMELRLKLRQQENRDRLTGKHPEEGQIRVSIPLCSCREASLSL